jgi:CTP synthase
MQPKFIFVIGGVLSGLGKGIVTSSIGRLLKSEGYSVTAVKIDPYLNIDAGTMRPTEHGEVWVTDDGGEIDQDLGNYERFLDVTLSKRNNLTTGQVYRDVIRKERQLKYGGKDVEVIPDIVNEIKDRIQESAKGFDFCIVEVGGTSGDIENLLFLHAVRELGRKEQAVYVMVTYIPFLRNVGELKTKPTQHAVARLREVGIMPDFIVTRSEMPIDQRRKWIIGARCFIDEENVIDDPDCNNIYSLPITFEKQKFGEEILKKFDMKSKGHDLKEWKKFVSDMDNAKQEVKIAMVGKYVAHGAGHHEDVYISIGEAVKHAGASLNIKPIIKQIPSQLLEEKDPAEVLKDYDAIIGTPGFGDSGVEGMINAIKYARENKIPYLGICYGMQMALIEIARNVCGLKGAHSSEVDPNTKYPVIDFLKEQVELMKKLEYGGTMRLGAYTAKLKPNTMVWELYGKKDEISERHRHRYEVNPKFIADFEKKGVIFSGVSPNRALMEFMELPKVIHPYFVATQSHPEFNSRPMKPRPLFLGLLNAVINNKN